LHLDFVQGNDVSHDQVSIEASPLRLSVVRATDAERVTAAHLEACVAPLDAAQDRLLALQREGVAGFLSLDWLAWGAADARAAAERLAHLGDTMLLLGIGGSALGARALRAAVGEQGAPGRQLRVLDTVDPGAVQSCLSSLDPHKVVIAAVSKSGSTLETVALLRVCIAWLQDSVGDAWSERVVVVTDAEHGALRRLANDRGLLSLPVPRDVGGRFSVLTAVGLLPAAFLGLDVDALCAAAEAQKSAVLQRDLARNPAWQMAALHHCWREHLGGSVLLSYSDALLDFGLWFRQLMAESLGKVDDAGQRLGWRTSVARGPADQHSQLQLWRDGPRDELFTVLFVEESAAEPALPALTGPEGELGASLEGRSLADLLTASRQGLCASLVSSGVPVIELSVRRLDESALGALFVLFETTVALLGLMRGINPFDQPAVEDAKVRTKGLLAEQDPT